MHAKLIRLLLSGILVIPVCFTGVVTAFQFQENRDAGREALSLLASNAVNDASTAAQKSDETTRIVPRPPAEETDQVKTVEPAAPGTVAVPPAPATLPEAEQKEAAKKLLQTQRSNREYFARLTVDGLLPGRLQYVDGRSRGLVPAKRVTISFVQSGTGKVVSQARPGVDGFFQAAGLVPGFYTVVASGLDGVLTFGIEIQPPLTESSNPKSEGRVKEDVRMRIDSERFRLRQTESENMRDSESFLRIDAVLVPPRDIPLARRILDPFVTPVTPLQAPRAIRAMSTGEALQNAQRTIQLVKGQQTQLGKAQTTRLVQAQTTNQSPPNTIRGSWGTPLRLPIFYTHSNGTIGGRLTTFVPDVTNRDIHFRTAVADGTVYFIRNGAVVEQARTDQKGRFQLPRIPV